MSVKSRNINAKEFPDSYSYGQSTGGSGTPAATLNLDDPSCQGTGLHAQSHAA